MSERGIHVGVFGLVDVLGRQCLLSAEDEQWRRQRNRWFDDAYRDPSTVDPAIYDHEVNPGAVAWERVESDDPGRVVYEDAHQVVVVQTRGHNRLRRLALSVAGSDGRGLCPRVVRAVRRTRVARSLGEPGIRLTSRRPQVRTARSTTSSEGVDGVQDAARVSETIRRGRARYGDELP
ncbi:hypothetical protein [Nocardioides sp. P5_C9_2]